MHTLEESKVKTKRQRQNLNLTGQNVMMVCDDRHIQTRTIMKDPKNRVTTFCPKAKDVTCEKTEPFFAPS